MITVVIVDDHPVVRAGLRAILGATEDIQVAAEGATAADALRLTGESQADVLVLDINLPDGSGLDVARKLAAQKIATAILILTVHRDSQTVFGVLECGARGYVLKDEALETLENAVRAVASGESWLSPAIATQVVHRAVKNESSQPGTSRRTKANLTPAELRVLRLLATGLDNTAIARQLVVAQRTVQNHVSNLYGKLGVTSRTEAMLYAIQHGLVEVQSIKSDADEH